MGGAVVGIIVGGAVVGIVVGGAVVGIVVGGAVVGGGAVVRGNANIVYFFYNNRK